MTKFFVPFASDAEQAERVYDSVRQFMAQQGFRLSDRRIERLTYRHNGKRYDSVVGQIEDGIGETTIAIFAVDPPGPRFLVCTTNRGVAGGGPIMVGDEYAVAVPFEPKGAE